MPTPGNSSRSGRHAAQGAQHKRRRHNLAEDVANPAEDAGVHVQEVSDSARHAVVMSVFWSHETLGIAVWYKQQSKVQVSQAHVPTAALEPVVAQLLEQLVSPPPTLALTSSSCAPQLGPLLQKPHAVSALAHDDMMGEQEDVKVDPEAMPAFGLQLHVCRAMQYNLDTAAREIEALGLFESFPGVLDPHEEETLIALGALLQHIRRDPDAASMPPLTLEHIVIDNVMYIDATSFKSLDIFSPQYHPSVIKGAGRSKEGYSLFSLLDNTYSMPGKRLLKAWMKCPVMDHAVLDARLDTVEVFMSPSNQELTKAIQKCMRNIRDVPVVATRFQQARPQTADWIALWETVDALVRMQPTLQVLAEITSPHGHETHVSVALSTITTPVQELCNILSSVLDVTACRTKQVVQIADNVDPTLDKQRETYASLPTWLTQLGEQDILQHKHLSMLQYHYVPQVGFLAVVAANEPDRYIPRDFREQYRTSTGRFFKNATTDELDVQLGDVHSIISDIEASILAQLCDEVRSKIDYVVAAVDAVAVLDVCQSFAFVAASSNYCRPEFTDSNVVFAKGSRHPLQELHTDPFIPNDVLVNPSREGAVSVITGPNGSGKSVYLKQVGLLVYMAHIGCFVPATKAIIGAVDRVAMNDSSFSLDLKQISVMLAQATSRSLLLIDEFGKGTAPMDGIALAAATLQQLVGPSSPKTFMSTHFHELFSLDLVPSKGGADGVNVFQMSVICNQDAGAQAGGSLVCLFKLVHGHGQQSYGIPCAAAAGIPSEVTKRAADILQCFSARTPILSLAGSATSVAVQAAAIKALFSVEDWTSCDASAFDTMHQLMQQLDE